MNRIKAILESRTNTETKVNKLLQYDCELHTGLGLESTETEKKDVAILSDKIIDEIVKLNPELIYLKESRNQ